MARNPISDEDGIGFLHQACRNQMSMNAHEFYKIAGLRPQTVRAARLRARKRGEPDPVPMLRAGSYDLDLVAAIHWLQRTGRNGSLLRLKAYFDDILMDSIALMRGVRIGHSLNVVQPMPKD